MDIMYSLQDVQKSYENRTVLEIDRLEIRKGEILAIVGPSGAGKSTLLRLLNFLEYADRGDVRYKGIPSNPALPLNYRREVTTVFQKPALLKDSVVNNVSYGLRLRGCKDFNPEVQKVLERLGLVSLQKAAARTLSGGEAQRVALGRAMVLNPEVLLLDEPTANLDPYNIGLIEDVVREVNQTRQTTIVLVTHNIFQARRLADRIGLMLNGEVIEMAECQQFFEKPVDDRTHAFVNGEMIY
jgi:tungstate transport system ATP-binding protein